MTLSFDLNDGRQVFGFIPFGAQEDDLAAVTAALDSDREWKLARFVTDDGAYCTKYFSDNMPDPERFLGQPLLSEIPTSESPSQNE